MSNFHIHVDAHKPFSATLRERFLSDQRFKTTNFDGHPEGYAHFEPLEHFTAEIEGSVEDFHSLFGETEQWVMRDGSFTGYVEGEQAKRIALPQIAKVTGIMKPLPFKVAIRELTALERFREEELHLVFDFDASDPRVVKEMLEGGLFGAFFPEQKPDGRNFRELVLTAQGKRHEVRELIRALTGWLEEVGGLVDAYLIHEIAMRYYLQHIGVDKLPKVVDAITWR